MKKKIKYVVGHGASQLKPAADPKRHLLNPRTGTPVFATFPVLVSKHKDFASGPIYLREGSHTGPHNGHGFTHIWREHFPQIFDPMVAQTSVIALVNSILISGADIYYEVASSSRDDRATVVHRPDGLVIVGQAVDGQGTIYYTVVTAIPNANARGTLIGRL